MKSNALDRWGSRPLRLLGLVIGVIAGSELLGTVVLGWLPRLSSTAHGVAEASLQVVLVGPGLYWLMCRPIALHLRARRKADAELRLARGKLEYQIQQRSAELAGANHALRRSEAQYRLLFEGNPHPMWILDVETLKFLAVNNAVIAHYGYSREEFARMSLADLCLPENVPGMRVAVGRTNGAMSRVGVVPHRKRDGTVVLTEIIVQALTFNGRRAELVLAHDVTERRQAAAALEREHERLLLLIEITRAIREHQDLPSLLRVVLTHLEDHLPIELGSAMLYNDTAKTLTLVARGPRSRALAAANGWPKEGDVLQPVEAGLAPCLEGKMVYWKDGAETGLRIPQRYARAGLRSIVAAPLQVGDRLVGVLAVARQEANGFSDAECAFLRQLGEHVALAAAHTELLQNLRRAYDDLRQSQQMALQQERLRALGEMASGIVHDINNALMPIVGFSDLLLQRQPNPDGEERHYLHAIKTAGQDITATVARMREFYRKRGKAEELRPVEVNQLIRQTVELTRPRWRDIPQERGRVIKIELVLDASLTPVLGSESELREALTNLIGNAVDAMPEGGTITLRTRLARDEVELEVSDTGTGMDEEVRKRCLEPFYTTKGERGTGLGLAMVYGTMQRHEGRIEIQSALGRGTTVRLALPLRQPRPAAAAELEPVARRQPLFLLVVDDDPRVGDGVIRPMLEQDGHRVAVADSGQAGITALHEAHRRGQPFDAVLTDLGMPYVDGRQVARAIKVAS
ncbi:MAG: GAF domain-containing protein, partial [Verrucomicrobia bacterium]|nr:GAF domain-containing protein [Verrucomicrobiota bacterium]